MRSLISTFVIRYLLSKVTGSDISYFLFLGGLQLDKVSGYTPGNHFAQWKNQIFNYIQIVGQNFCVPKYRWRVQRYWWCIYKRHSMHKIKLNVFQYSMHLTCLHTVLCIICRVSENIISYRHNIQLILPSVSMYQHITTFQLTHKKIEGERVIHQWGKRKF